MAWAWLHTSAIARVKWRLQDCRRGAAWCECIPKLKSAACNSGAASRRIKQGSAGAPLHSSGTSNKMAARVASQRSLKLPGADNHASGDSSRETGGVDNPLHGSMPGGVLMSQSNPLRQSRRAADAPARTSAAASGDLESGYSNPLRRGAAAPTASKPTVVGSGDGLLHQARCDKPVVVTLLLLS